MLKNGYWFAVTVGIQLHSKCRGRVEDVVRDPRDREVVDEETQPEHGVGGGQSQPPRPGQLEVRGLNSSHLVEAPQHLAQTETLALETFCDHYNYHQNTRN